MLKEEHAKDMGFVDGFDMGFDRATCAPFILLGEIFVRIFHFASKLQGFKIETKGCRNLIRQEYKTGILSYVCVPALDVCVLVFLLTL